MPQNASLTASQSFLSVSLRPRKNANRTSCTSNAITSPRNTRRPRASLNRKAAAAKAANRPRRARPVLSVLGDDVCPMAPNTRVKPTREAGSAWTNCYAHQGNPEAAGPQRDLKSGEHVRTVREPRTGRGQQRPKPTAPPIRRSLSHPCAERRKRGASEAE